MDANDYARFSKIQDDEDGKAASEANEDVANKQIKMLAEYFARVGAKANCGSSNV